MLACDITYNSLTSGVFGMGSRNSWNEQPLQPAHEEMKFKCSRCPRSFKRMEHLKRHRRIHDGTKRFICSTCSKGFARSDILHRHELIHVAPPHDSLDTRRKRACLECAKARERCTKGIPCSRCSSRSLECIYPDVKSEDSSSLAPNTIASSTSSRNQHQLSSHQRNIPTTPTLVPLGSLTGYREGLFTNSEVLNFGHPRSDSGLASTIIGTAATTLACSSSLDEIPTLQAPCSVPELYSPMKYLSPTIQDIDSAQGQPEYSPALSSPTSWLPATETVAIGYNSLVGFGMNEPFNYGGVSPGLSSDIQPVGHHPMGSYTSQPWMTGSGSGEQSFNYTGHLPIKVDVAGCATLMSLSPIVNDSAMSQLSGDTIPPSSSWMDPFRNFQELQTISGPPSTTYGKPNLATENQRPFWIPPLEKLPIDDLGVSLDCPQVSAKAYNVIKQEFKRLCLVSSGVYSLFLSSDFPGLEQMNFFIRLYFSHFDPVLPILHSRRLNLDEFWPLALALSAVGCNYGKRPEFSLCAGPLHEFLRRALAIELDSGKWTKHVIPLTQALVLNQIGILYGGSPQSPALARAKHRTMVEIVETFGLLRSEGNTIGLSKCSWADWLADEAKRRLGYSVWLLDSMSAYHFGQRPLLCLDHAQCKLPNASLWDARTEVQWSERLELSKEFPSLPEAVNTLYNTGEIVSNLGDFGELILLHGVYEESFRSKGYFMRQMSPSSPTLLAQNKGKSTHHIIARQKSSLDCVEVMNRAATASMFQSGGIERSSILHLAIARVVILVPYESIQTLVKSISSHLPHDTILRSNAIGAEQEVFRWAQQDEHIARKAVLYCGIFFWHIRRFSQNAFYEPVSVYLATLTLWAYSSYASRLPQPEPGQNLSRVDGMRSGSATRHANPNQGSPTLARFEDQRKPTFIRLDRPNDDETIQLFIKSGGPLTMRAHITGVGDIYSPQGPVSILREGRKVLAAVSTAWGHTQDYASVLEALERSGTGQTIPVL